MNDCARSRLWNRMAEVYVIDPITDDFQQIRCPLSRCPKTFLCPKQMLRHLKVCKYFSEGSFKCPICKETEDYPTASCRRGRWDRVTLKQRFGNSVESLCNSLRRSSRDSVSPPHCEGCKCSHPSGMRSSPASSDETLPAMEKSASADSAMSTHDCYGFMELKPVVEMEGTIPRTELEDPTLALVLGHTGSSAYRPSNFISELPTECPPVKLSSPLTSQSEDSPTTVSPASSGHGTSQNHTGLGTDASNNGNQPTEFQARFNNPDNVSDLYSFQFKDIDQSSTINSVFKHTSVHEELSSPPVDPCYHLDWLSSRSVSGPQNRDAVYFAPEALDLFHPIITTALDTPQQHINIDTAPLGGSPSSIGGLAPIYDTSPSSKSNTSFADSDLLSPDQADDETAVLKCDQCEFVPTGSKKKNFKAYLRKHRRIHDERRVTCVQCNKEFTRQDNLTAHKQRVHQRKRHHESETDFGEQIPQRKKSRSSRRGGSESPSGYMF